MNKLATENIWWPPEHENGMAVVNSVTEVIEGSNQHHCHPPVETTEHLYVLKQTAERIIWACACGRTLSRRKYPPYKRN